jgi:hypothetical protein
MDGTVVVMAGRLLSTSEVVNLIQMMGVYVSTLVDMCRITDAIRDNKMVTEIVLLSNPDEGIVRVRSAV